MQKKIFVVVIVCMVLFTSVAAAQRPLRDLLDRIFGMEKEVQITEIEDILEDPEKYKSKDENDTVTVEGTFGKRVGYGWMRGDIYGIYDEEGNAINVRFQNKPYESAQLMMGKKVRATGLLDPGIKDSEDAGPILHLFEEAGIGGIEVIE